ncbi:MAG: isoprenylcysteine carboxylmethyltransferase family protein [Bacteroidales bacterium]|nr:isoprenylcysteine carboxylmethyltransferase family protein [Bacteroidales bacterium]
MYWFIIPLVFGFTSNVASTFTTLFSEKWGKVSGSLVTIILRDIIGIPVWAIGFLLAIRESQGLFYENLLFARIAGWIVLFAGAVIIVIALVSIRLKAAAPSTGDKLVNKGIYSVVRHPIHTGTFLEFTGLFLLWPSFQTVIACILGIIWILVQTKYEEKDLLKRIPEYRDYMKQVPRFFPSSFRKNSGEGQV